MTASPTLYPMHTLGLKRLENVYQCDDCAAEFYGTGCIFRVRAHTELTGHTVRQNKDIAPKRRLDLSTRHL